MKKILIDKALVKPVVDELTADTLVVYEPSPLSPEYQGGARLVEGYLRSIFGVGERLKFMIRLKHNPGKVVTIGVAKVKQVSEVAKQMYMKAMDKLGEVCDYPTEKGNRVGIVSCLYFNKAGVLVAEVKNMDKNSFVNVAYRDLKF